MKNIFIKIRSLICPFNKIECFVPKQGKILDLGCGHGIFSSLLVQKSPNRNVLGIDPSEYKIKLAKNNFGKLKNLKFQTAFLKDIKKQKFDCIVMLDVLYLLTNNEKKETLQIARNLLSKNGTLILKTISHHPKLLLMFSKWEEILMVKFIKYTYSNTKELYFLSEEKYSNLLKNTGFIVNYETSIQGLPYRHHIFIAKK